MDGRVEDGETLKVLDIPPGFVYNMTVRQDRCWKSERYPGEVKTHLLRCGQSVRNVQPPLVLADLVKSMFRTLWHLQ